MMTGDDRFPMTPEDRYRTDAHFRTLVDMLEHMIHQAQYTPSELRDASLLAAIHYEYHNARPTRWLMLGEFECNEKARIEYVPSLGGTAIRVPAKGSNDVVAIRVYGRGL